MICGSVARFEPDPAVLPPPPVDPPPEPEPDPFFFEWPFLPPLDVPGPPDDEPGVVVVVVPPEPGPVGVTPAAHGPAPTLSQAGGSGAMVAR